MIVLPKKIKITSEQTGQRLDVFLTNELGITRSQIQKMIKKGMIFVNNVSPKKFGEKLFLGDVISLVEKNQLQKRKFL
ncbi:MAG: RNA-binding S4 domain-containing protein [Patescibacteria group bacterium]|jgi:23S rRNA-/tRNA-specific pseudouridylate synthase|nr:S4 domain-containing protein [Candidatus Magasanikbacteria bacterium]